MDWMDFVDGLDGIEDGLDGIEDGLDGLEDGLDVKRCASPIGISGVFCPLHPYCLKPLP
jgi:hypothetical protein